jgi:hypothetical protein
MMSAPPDVETATAELIAMSRDTRTVVRAATDSSVEIRAYAHEAVARAAATVERSRPRQGERERYLAQKERERADASR